MSDVNANIGIHFDTNDALEQLRRLQAGLSRFNQSLTQGNVAAENAQKGLNAQLMQSINATGKFVASQKTVSTSTASFTEALEKNKLSMREYFRYTAAAATANTKVLKGAFSSEREIINRARKDRVKALQTQYIQLTDANGQLVKTLQIVPKHLKMVNGEYTDYATRVQMAAQRQQLMNQLLKQGSTQLLNFGKNTQWAGRQLMVGITVPLTMLGGVASKAFQEMEEAVIKFTRVYGDMTTSVEDTDKAVRSIQLLAKEFTKYGIAAADTVKMAADAAAMGLTGGDLTAQVTAATKLAVLGQVEQQQALETTISLQNAFGISADQLAQKINFLNAVENQTVLSIADLTEAIPKAGPVIKQLGGSVEDLAFFMTAMKEGGINASEGANALKSGLASMINPSKKASEMLAGFGISIKGIVDANAGNLKGTVLGIARALDTLDPLNRARAIETMFGKFQFARISTLFQNITKDGSQASRALGLASASVEELAILSERELGKVENAVGVKFKKQMENLKLQLVPIGKAFLEAITPVVKFAASILEKFNNLSDGTKKFVVMMLGFLGGIAPVALMTFGVVANGVANLIKFFAMLRGGMAKLNGQNNVLGGGFDYLTQQEIESLAQAKSLHNAHQDLIATFNIEKASVDALASAYANAASQARALASGSPALFNTVPGAKGAVSGLPKFANGGVVPGTGNKDTVAAMLTPGEVVLTKDTVKQNPELVAALQNNSVKKYNGGTGRMLTASQTSYVGGLNLSPKLADEVGKQLEFINKASSDKLIAYAKATGIDIADASEASLEKVRETLVKEVQGIFSNVAKTAEEKGKELTVSALKRSTKKKGTAGEDASIHEFYNPRAHQQQSTQFGHAETSNTYRADQISQVAKISDAKAQAELDTIVQAITAHNAKTGDKVEMPKVTPVSGFGFDMKGEINKAMNDASVTLKDGTETIDAFMKDFKERGIEKWRKSVEIGGGNFEELSASLKVYDDKILQAVQSWKTANPGKPFTDTDFMKIEQSVRSQVLDVGSGLGQVFEEARSTITAIRLKLTKAQRDILNENAVDTGAVAPGKEKYASDRSTYQLGGTERRNSAGYGKFIDEELTAGEKAAETKSPSERTRRLGVNIGEGLRIGLEQKTKDVKSQSDKLSQAAMPSVDTANKAKYDILKNDPEQRQIQKSIDRHYRGITGKSKLPVPQNATATETSVSVDVNPKALAKDAIALKEAAKSAKKSAKRAGKAQEELADATKETASEQKKHASEVKRTRKKAKKTADAAGDVLVAETDVARSTARTATASETQAQNVVSAGELTQATETALQESADNNKQIVKAEEDRAKSAEEIAKLENAIEDKKRREKERGQAALAAQMAGPTIPGGSQTSNNFVNPLTAMSYEAAYEEASSYTRNKKGQLLRDPETGEPTTLNAKEIAQKKRGMRREKVGRVSGKISGGLGTAAMVAGMAGAPAPVTAALGGAATVAQFAPMIAGLSGPQGVVAALAALAAGAYLLNKKLEGTAVAIAKFVRETSVGSDMLKKIGEQTGKVGANEIMNRRRSEGSFDQYIETGRKGTTEAQKFLEGEAGKALQKAYVSNAAKNGAEKAANDFALQIAAAISDGTIPEYLGPEIARQMGINLKDIATGMRIDAKIRSLVGPKGEDLLKDPLLVRTRISLEGAQNAEKVAASIYKNQGGWMNNESGSDKSAAFAVAGSSAIEIAQAQADAMQLYYDNQVNALKTQIAATTDKQKQVELQAKLVELTNQQNDGMTKMNNLVAAQITRQEVLANKLMLDRKEGSKQSFFNSTFLDDARRREDAFFDAQKADVKAKYKGTQYEAAAQRVLGLGASADEDKTFSSKAEGRTFEAKVNFIMQSGQMNPAQVESMMKIFSGNLKSMDTALNIGIRTHGGSKMAELASMLTGIKKEKAQSIILTMARKNPAEFDKVAKTLAILQRSDGLEVDMEAFINIVGMPGLNALSRKLDALEALPDPITKEVAVKWATDNNIDPTQLIKDWEYYDALKPEVRKEALQTYTTMFTTATAFKTNTERDAWAQSVAEREASLAGAKGSKEYNKVLTTTFQLLTVGADGKPLDVNSPEYKMAAGTWSQQATVAIHGTPTTANSKDGKLDGALDKKDRDTTYDDLMKRLRNVRLAALDASKGFNELQKAIAATGSKAIKDQFNGLEQQLIKMGQTQQFTDYLAGLDQKELNKFGKTATKKGTQKYTEVDPLTGKKVTRTQNYKAGDFVLNQKGRDYQAGINKAIQGDYNKAQLLSVTLNKQEIQARTKLLAMGFEEADVKTMIADENYRTLIATGKVTQKELETNAALTKQARLRSQISSAVAGGRDLAKVAENQKRIPEVVQMMQMANISAEGIRSAISDPAMLDTLIQGMDNFAVLGQDAQDEFRTLMDQINDIPSQKIIELVFTQTEAQKQIAGSQAAAELFDAYKMIDENTIKNAEGNTYAGLQVMMEDLNNQAKVVQDQMNLTQSKIDTMQQEVEADQRKIENEITRPIEKKQRAIEKLSRDAEMNFSRPISALQERSAVLSHDLEVMNHSAEEINKKYDKQQEALQQVANINQQIIQQQQQQLGLADALSKGDISAAAKAVQDMRATSASNYATNAQDALQKARENEIKGLKGGVSGLTQEQIQEQQYQIGLQVYDLEQKKAAVDKQILAIQDEIYALEQQRQTALDAIQVKTDAIAAIQFGELLTQQNKLKAINDQNLKYQLQSDLLFNQIATNDKNRIIQGATRSEWDAMLKAAEAQEKLAKGDLAKALGVVGDISGKAATAWKSIKDAYDGIVSKSTEITQYIKTVYGPAPENPATQQPTATKPPTKEEIAKIDANKDVPSYLASQESGALGAASIAAKQKAAAAQEAASAALKAQATAITKAKLSGNYAYQAMLGGMSSGGLVPKYFAAGGFARGTDIVPAMLTPGEFVMSKYAVNTHGLDTLKAMNAGAKTGDSVYNYSLTVNAGSNATPDDIARTVMNQIKQIDSQRIRGNRF